LLSCIARHSDASKQLEGNIMTRFVLALALLTATASVTAAHAQEEGPTPTQAMVAFDSKSPVTPTASNVTIKVNNRATPLLGLSPIPPNGAQVAILIDAGLRSSINVQLDDLRAFIQGLPAGTEVFVGYMQNGRTIPAADPGFTADHAAAAAGIRISTGIAGVDASPYFCLSDFVKNWPGNSEQLQQTQPRQTSRKARFVLMLTNGVDPYNGSTSVMNQNSPYVQTAVNNAQSAGVPVYSIYYGETGGFNRRRSASFSGQSYLAQLAEGTGGLSLYTGIGNPVSLQPYLKQFQAAISETYVATFSVPASKNLARLNTSTNLPKTKVRSPNEVRAGTVVLQP
jgi:hypothetical protein